jgi:hypothetical protein
MGTRTAFRLALLAAITLAILSLSASFAFAQTKSEDAAAIAQADLAMKKITHAVQLGLERFNVDVGVYPDSIQELFNEGYLDGMPDNPYASLWSQAPAKCIVEEMSPRATPGAIVYHPFSISGDSLDAYFLLAAGLDTSKTHDLFYGEPRWDSLSFLLPSGKGDGRTESYIMLLPSVPIIAPDMVVAVSHDAAWLEAQPMTRAKEALHSVQLAAERWSVDDVKGAYPPDIQTLVKEGYIYMPLNPYYGVVPGATMRIEVCAPGEFKPGGIVYQPFTMPEKSGDGLVGYQIGIFGDDPDGGIDAGATIDGTWRFYDFLEEPKNPDGISDGFVMVLGSGPSPEGECAAGT